MLECYYITFLYGKYMNKLKFLPLLAVLISGCATSPVVYEKWGRMQGGLELCRNAGYIDATTYAKGRALLNDQKSMNIVDPQKLDEATRQAMSAYASSVNRRDCEDIAGTIGLSYENATRPAPTVVTPMIKAPTTTYCNRIGTQVFCNSF